MFNEISPRVYSTLRRRACLSQDQLGSLLNISRSKVIKVEAGRAQLDAECERKLMEVAGCSREEFAELACRQLSEVLQKQVRIRCDAGSYEPSTALARARQMLRDHALRIPAAMVRALNNRINSTQLLGLAFERNNADLEELARDCLTELTKE